MPVYEIEKKPSIGWKKRNMGFIVDEHQINVALTRARLGLIIVGEFNINKVSYTGGLLSADTSIHHRSVICRHFHTMAAYSLPRLPYTSSPLSADTSTLEVSKTCLSYWGRSFFCHRPIRLEHRRPMILNQIRPMCSARLLGII